MADFGYDVADYCDVDPLFGTLARPRRADRGLPRARASRSCSTGCPNHTSRPAPVVRRVALEPRQPEARLVRLARRAPNDWTSTFGPSARRGPTTRPRGQYYLHCFMAEQPDLNWDNPEVEAAMHDVLRFWLDRGVDGLRLDAIHKIAKDPLLRDHATAPRRHDEDWEHDPRPPARDPPGRRRVRGPHDRRRGALQDLHRVVAYLSTATSCTSRTTSSSSTRTGTRRPSRRRSRTSRRWPTEHAWPAWFLANHDNPRPASRFDHDGLGRSGRARSCVMLYALRGTPFIYQGEELGLPDAPIPPDRIVDVDGRDPERAPIPWTPGPRAPASPPATPWLPFVAEAEALNARTQAEDPRSTLNLARALARCARRARRCRPASSARTTPARRPGLDARRDDLLAAVNFTAPSCRCRSGGDAGALAATPTAQRRAPRSDPSEALILRIELSRGQRLAGVGVEEVHLRGVDPDLGLLARLGLALGVEPGDDDGVALGGGLASRRPGP